MKDDAVLSLNNLKACWDQICFYVPRKVVRLRKLGLAGLSTVWAHKIFSPVLTHRQNMRPESGIFQPGTPKMSGSQIQHMCSICPPHWDGSLGRLGCGHLEAFGFGFGFPSSQSSLSAMSFRAFSRLCSRAPSFSDLVLSPRLPASVASFLRSSALDMVPLICFRTSCRQLSKYAPPTVRFPARNCSTIKLIQRRPGRRRVNAGGPLSVRRRSAPSTTHSSVSANQFRAALAATISRRDSLI
jgi:hypothetical protein